MAVRKALLMMGLGAVFASAAFGGAPMGPPRAMLGEAQWSIGAEYGHENISFGANGPVELRYDTVPYEFIESLAIDDLRMNMFFATLAYGLCDTWDVYIRVGAADAHDEVTGTGIPYIDTDPGDQQEYALGPFGGGYGFAWGVGTRGTFCQTGPWSFGGLVQATWFKPDDSAIEYVDPYEGTGFAHLGQMSLDFWQAQVALAAIYQVDTVRVWVGPFLQFLNGDLERSGNVVSGGVTLGTFDVTSDIHEESQVGGHVGLDWEASQQMNLWVEGQFTSDSWFLGVGLVVKPEATSGL
jgi:hypothetical protein